MKKSLIITAQIEDYKAVTQKYLDENKVDEAKAKMAEIDELKAKLEMQLALEADEEKEAEDKMADQKEKTDEGKNSTKEIANAFRAVVKASLGQKLTEAEAALLPTGTSEALILPKDVKTKINELKRAYNSMKGEVGYMPVTTLTGSYVVEDFESLTGLIDFTDGTDGTEITDIKFKSISFSLKQKGGILSLSNTLLKMTDNALVDYVAGVFAKKAVMTENAMIVTALQNGKTAKALADWKALKTSINVDIDEALKFGMSIVTNQDGFNALDSALDTIGRPVLQPDPANPTKKLFMGVPVSVYSNSILPTTGTGASKKAPIYYGNLMEAIKFVDNDSYEFATSTHAGFKSNMTVARVIEYIDCIQHETSDKVYCYGQFSIA